MWCYSMLLAKVGGGFAQTRDRDVVSAGADRGLSISLALPLACDSASARRRSIHQFRQRAADGSGPDALPGHLSIHFAWHRTARGSADKGFRREAGSYRGSPDRHLCRVRMARSAHRIDAAERLGRGPGKPDVSLLRASLRLDATHHIFSVLFVYLAAAVIIQSRSAPRLLLAGLFLGMATCFTQTRALLVPAVAGFLVWDNRVKAQDERHLLREEISLFAPFAALVLMASAYVIWNAGPINFYRYIIRFPFLHYREGQGNNWSTAFEDWVPTVRGVAVWTFMKLLVPGSYLAFFAYGWMTKRRRGGVRLPLEAVLLAVVGLALFCTVAYAPLHVRLAGISLPAFVLVIWMLNQGASGLWKVPAWGVTAAFLVMAPLKTQLQHYWFYDTPAGQVAIEDHDLFSDLAWLDKHTDPGDKFFAASTPMFYVLLDLQNPARVPFVEPDGYTRPRQVARIARRLHREAPKFILWPFSRAESDDPGDPLYLLGRELRKDYRPVESLPDGTVWELNQQATNVSTKSQSQSPYRLEMPQPE